MSWKPLFILVCVFLTGTVSGVFLAIPLFQKNVEQRISSEQIAPRQLRRFEQRLKLSPEQVEKVKPIIQKHSEELRKARSEAHRNTLDILARMESNIAKELTPEQKDMLKVMQAEEAERIRQLLESRGKKPPPPPKKEPSKRPPQKKDSIKKDAPPKDGQKKKPSSQKKPPQQVPQ